MSIVYLVLPLALVIVLAAVLAFVWAARGGQFDDLETPALRVMHDDEAIRATPSRPLGDASRNGARESARESAREGATPAPK